jgi:hypothetical protein
LSKVKELTGQKFGRLHVISIAGRGTDRHVLWNCMCDCGTECIVSGSTLRSKFTKSCGCLSSEMVTKRNTIHGYNVRDSVTPEYRAYANARQRCTNPKSVGYDYYGGRGIEFKFESFEQFIAEVGNRPEGMSLDRVDPDKNYEIGNVKWSTRKEQSINKRRCNDLSAMIVKLQQENSDLKSKLENFECQVCHSKCKEAQHYS